MKSTQTTQTAHHRLVTPSRLCGYSPAQHTYAAEELLPTGTDNPPLSVTPTPPCSLLKPSVICQPGWAGFEVPFSGSGPHTAQKPSLVTHPRMTTPAPGTKHCAEHTHWGHRIPSSTHPTNTSLHHPKTTTKIPCRSWVQAPVLAIQSQAWSISQT